ncbi:hypothetical protein E2C01_022943 [Portunus trituberculatus]|uniref:Uncharacterized protein n=1 Tax=Portunus trituberculatus TaxID=210409 RepID=A0A5B7E8M0_PORTR|nr:hypothetical protein [Portunus trituberculatus]
MDPGHLIKVMAPPEQSLLGAQLGDSLVLGVWSPQEQRFHINHLKMMTVFWALRSFQQEVSGTVVSLMSDNSTVVAY